AKLVEVPSNGADDSGPQLEIGPRLLVHQQIEVALAIAGLDVGEPVERVRQWLVVLRQQLERVDRDGRLSALRSGRRTGDANDVAQVQLDRPRAARVAEQLDPARAIDEIEEDDLPELAPRHHAARDVARVGGLDARLQLFSLGADNGDLVRVREALRQGHRRASLTSANVFGVSRLRHAAMSRRPVPFIDGHNDVLLALSEAGEGPGPFLARRPEGHLDLERAREGGFAAGFFAIFVEPEGEAERAATRIPHRTPPYAVPLAGPIPTDHAVRQAGPMVEVLAEPAAGDGVRVAPSFREGQAAI